jgi:hypothetical protein
MMDISLHLISRPTTQAISGVSGATAGIGGVLGILNPWISAIILVISLLTAAVGLYYKFKIAKKEDELKQLELDEYKRLHNHRDI